MFEQLKQLKDLREQAKAFKEKMNEIVVSGEAENGKIKVTMDGSFEVKSVELDQELLGEKARLEEGLKKAFNTAREKSQRQAALKLQQGL